MRSLVAVATAALVAAHGHGKHQHREKLSHHDAEFAPRGRSLAVEANARVSFTAALYPRNTEELESRVLAAADPASPSYGRWMSQQEVNALIAPPAEDRAAVKGWLSSSAKATCVDLPFALRCSAPVAELESALGTEFTAYEHVPKGTTLHRVAPDQRWTFPAELNGKLALISGLADFPTLRKRAGSGVKAFSGGRPHEEHAHKHSLKSHAHKHGRSLHGGHKSHKGGRFHSFGSAAALADDDTAGAGDNLNIALETLQSLYAFSTAQQGTAAVSVGAAEFQDDSSYLPSDLVTYASQSAVQFYNMSHIVGPFNDANPDTESELDVQMILGIAQANTQWFWTETDWMLEFTQHVASLPDGQVPDTFSISWGWWEGDQCSIDSTGGPCKGGNDSGSLAYVNVTNTGLAAIAARGISMFAASGDSGAHGRTDSMCFSNVTRPIFPGSSPWVTTVGGTQLVNGTKIANATSPYCRTTGSNCGGKGTEVVCSTATGAEIVSGGGFSTVASQPSWQSSAVSSFLSSGALNPGPGNYNPAGRGYPDLAAAAHNVVIWTDGTAGQVDGTSCATPIVAALFSQLNAQRVQAGKAKLGFLNPLIYSKFGTTPGAFTDVTVGDNRCSEDNSWFNCVSCTGYAATKGWDPVTGWGTPRFDVWTQIVASLP